LSKSELASAVDVAIVETFGHKKTGNRNFFTEQGATVLAKRIKRFWRGSNVTVWVEPIGHLQKRGFEG